MEGERRPCLAPGPMSREVRRRNRETLSGREPCRRFGETVRRCMGGLLLLMFALLATPGHSDSLFVEVEGIRGEMAENVEAFVGSAWISGSVFSSVRRRVLYETETSERAARALRPFGYYGAKVSSSLQRKDEDSWRLLVRVEPGAPVLIDAVSVELLGPGAEFKAFADWRENWSLRPGDVLDQKTWEALKTSVMDIAEEEGFLTANFVESTIALDLENDRADLSIKVDTGARAVMGAVTFEQDQVSDYVLQPIPRFIEGDPYRSWLVDRFRTDLWKSGYFGGIDLVEERRLEEMPPRVDFRLKVTPRKPDTHQGTIGYGTDSEFRVQYGWARHLLSRRGDSIAAGLGWQQRFNELRASIEYRLPRATLLNRKFWVANSIFKREQKDLLIEVDQDSAADRGVAAGSVVDYLFRAGHLTLRHLGRSQELISETLFVDYLIETDDFNAPEFTLVAGLPNQDPEFRLSRDITSLAAGLEYDWPVIMGTGFQTVGHHERARVIAASEALGSDVGFTQLYLSTRWHFLLAQRWMLMVRGEVGYSDAEVDEFEVRFGDRVSVVSVTQLPDFYRFKAGGSQSVRGYEFESLTNNGIGSNNIVTASVELEHNFKGDWAGSLFFDVGNSFNDWDAMDLKRGWGVGLRWYTIAGAIRLDLAQALDYRDKPWTIHFTIGTPLL